MCIEIKTSLFQVCLSPLNGIFLKPEFEMCILKRFTCVNQRPKSMSFQNYPYAIHVNSFLEQFVFICSNLAEDLSFMSFGITSHLKLNCHHSLISKNKCLHVFIRTSIWKNPQVHLESTHDYVLQQITI